jgi:ribosomal protein S18 acetylase RimI-like enzyme
MSNGDRLPLPTPVANGGTDMTDNYTIRPMTGAEIEQAVDWAAAEGWNPGHRDAACFAAVDAEGFIGGFLDGKMIASISVINYDPQFSFLGFYIVVPEQRGKGFGHRLWKDALKHAGSRMVGLDGVIAEQDNYRRSGFKLAYRNIRYGGGITSRTSHREDGSIEIMPLDRSSPEIAAYDRKLFPAARDGFLQAWISADGHVARTAHRGGKLAGYGAIRPCRTGFKIGPLFADDREVASALLAQLIAETEKNDEIFLDVPEPNEDAVSLARALGLEPVFETARMYTGAAPAIDLNRMFGVTTFELG